jgi:pilus assembly protein CpaE
MKFLAIIQDPQGAEIAAQLAARFSVANPVIVTGNIADGSAYLRNHEETPEYVYIDIGHGYGTVLEELDELAENCQVNTKVVMVGVVNDLSLYRQLLQRGIVEYFVKPVSLPDLGNAFSGAAAGSRKQTNIVGSGKVISFMSAASGDGATTIAINTAFMLARDFNQPTVILDLDYQYGMVARNLDLISNHGLREILDQPEGTIDISFIEKTIVKYSENLYVISAPKNLRFVPKMSPVALENLLNILRAKFKYVIVDLPHLWVDWVANVIGEADRNIMVAQLWIKSAAHASRFLDVAQTMGITAHKTAIVINRSGSKFKEAITPSEFSTACKKKIDYYISNESKTIITAENQGKTAVEMSNSVLNKQIREIAESIFQMSDNK